MRTVSETGPPLDRHLSALRWIRRGVILLLGVSVLLVGVVMIVAPGPAFLVIPLGLVILATEFAWARRVLRKLRDHLRSHGVDPVARFPWARRLWARLGAGEEAGGGKSPPGPGRNGVP